MPTIAIEDIDWRAVRQAYEACQMTIDEIVATFEVSRDRLYRRAKQENWPTRTDLKKLPPVMRASRALTNEQGEEITLLEKRAALAARLFHALEERIMVAEEEAMLHDASYGERDAKALSALARALEQLSDMLEQATPTPTTQADEEMNADEFRHLLTGRLDRLRERRSEQGVDEPPF